MFIFASGCYGNVKLSEEYLMVIYNNFQTDEIRFQEHFMRKNINIIFG